MIPELGSTFWIPTSIALVSLTVSICVAVSNWRFNKTITRYTAWNQYMNALFQIEREFIERPELWAIFDDHPMAQNRDTGCVAAARRDALLWYLFDLMETVVNDHLRVLRHDKDDNERWSAWKGWIRDVFERSSDARRLFEAEKRKGVFTRSFVRHVDATLESLARQREPQ